MEDFAKKIVEKIKNLRISPKSKFRLNLKNYAFWILLTFIIVLGGFFFSLMVLNFADVNMRMPHFLGVARFMKIMVITAPLFWIILSIVALVSGVLAFKKTSRGYRYNTLFVASLVVLIISLVGFFAHFSKMNDSFDKKFQEKAPAFREFSNPREGRWMRPEDGLLAGTISEISADSFTLKNRQNKSWKVYYSPETERKNITELKEGMKVGVIGEKIDEFSIKALAIMEAPLGRERDDIKERDGMFEEREHIFIENEGMMR